MHQNLRKLKELTDQLNVKDRELKQQRHKYKSLVELLPEVVLVHKYNEILFINEYGLNVFGYEYKHEIIGKDIKTFVHPEDLSKAKLLLKNISDNCPQGDFIEMKLLKKDGSVIQGELGSTKITWDGMDAVQTVIRDVTKRKNIENALIRYYHRTGKVNSLPISGYSTYELGDGWTINLIGQGEQTDHYIINAKEGTELPRHHHIQREKITVESGKIIAYIDDERFPVKAGESITIPSLSTHRLVAVNDTEMKVDFTPPLSSYEI